MVSDNLAETPRQESTTTFDRNIYFRRGLKRLKAEAEGFPTAQPASKTEITTRSYDRLLLSIITFDRDIRFGRGLKRWKTLKPRPKRISFFERFQSHSKTEITAFNSPVTTMLGCHNSPTFLTLSRTSDPITA